MSATHTFSIPVGADDLSQKLAFANENQLGLEIAAFASGSAVFDSVQRSRLECDFALRLRDFPHLKSFHGAFIDVLLHSEDPRIAGIARERIENDVATASRLGCSIVVFHTGFNPLIPVTAYEEHFYARHAEFWPGLADRYPGLTICLENLWEPDPSILRNLILRINHPRVRVCFDVAHAHVYSHFPAKDWIRDLEDFIGHMHWNDNCGDRDNHLALGNGTILWPAFLKTADELRRTTTVLLELRSLEAIRTSFRYLNELKRAETSSTSTDPLVGY